MSVPGFMPLTTRINFIVAAIAFLCNTAGAAVSNVSDEFVRVAPDGWHFETSVTKQPFVPFGGAYYDIATYVAKPYPRFLTLSQFDETRTDRHLAQAASVGANYVRIHLSTSQLSPEYLKSNREAFQKLDRIIALARKHSLRVMLDLLLEWEGSSDWVAFDRFADETTLVGLEHLVGTVGERYKDDPTVWALLIGNEFKVTWDAGSITDTWNKWVRMKYGSETNLRKAWKDYPLPEENWNNILVPKDKANPGSTRLYDYQICREDIGTRWVKRLTGAIRSKDRNHLISFGNLQWIAPFRQNMPDTMRASDYPAFNPQKIGKYLDYMQINAYDWFDKHSSSYFQGLGRFTYYWDKPVIIGEYSFDVDLLQKTKTTFAGYTAWACYPLPDQPYFNVLFDSSECITDAGRSFAATASRIKTGKLTFNRAPDSITMNLSAKSVLTNPAACTDIYNRYIQMCANDKIVGVTMWSPDIDYAKIRLQRKNTELGVKLAIVKCKDTVVDCKGSRECRRTDLASGSDCIWFDVDDQYTRYKPDRCYVIEMDYFDCSTNPFMVDYDGIKKPGFRLKCDRTNTNTWKTASFLITDARFANRLRGGDIAIKALNSDLYVTQLRVLKPPIGIARGRVVDSATNRTISDANIIGSVETVKSSRDGSFAVKATNGLVVIKAAGYQTVKTRCCNIDITGEATNLGDIKMMPVVLAK